MKFLDVTETNTLAGELFLMFFNAILQSPSFYKQAVALQQTVYQLFSQGFPRKPNKIEKGMLIFF